MTTGTTRERPLTVMVADDEALARRRIVELLEGRSSVRLVGQSATGPATVEAVRKLDPDLLFLDVQMPGLDGFEVLSKLSADERPIVIFSTAYDEYAISAFRVHAVDYLLKPFADERFHESVQRALHAFRTRRAGDLHERLRHLLTEVEEGVEPGSGGPAGSNRHLRRFAVPEKDRRVMVDAADVDWIEADGDYVSLHVAERTHLLRGTMAALERQLDPARFLRIHRSTIVQLDRVQELTSDEHGNYEVVLRTGRRLRISRSYKDAALERLGVKW